MPQANPGLLKYQLVPSNGSARTDGQGIQVRLKDPGSRHVNGGHGCQEPPEKPGSAFAGPRPLLPGLTGQGRQRGGVADRCGLCFSESSGIGAAAPICLPAR